MQSLGEHMKQHFADEDEDEDGSSDNGDGDGLSDKVSYQIFFLILYEKGKLITFISNFF